ncbi:MAG: PEP-CTERM sorting domain-containing protein [Verrucomicrobiota bacterium]
MKNILLLLIGSMLCATVATAQIVNYSTSFTSADGFSNGTINGQNTWSAVNSAHYVISDSTGAGLVGSTNAAGPVHNASSTDLTSALASGATITMTLSANFTGTFINQNNGRWLLGIGTSDVSSQPLLGGGVFFNVGGSNFFVADETLSNGSKVDTGITFDSAFHTLTTTITRTATTNEFDVTVALDGSANTSSFTVSDAGLWSGSSTAYAGFRWQGNQTGAVDSFSVNSVPEPSTFLLLGLATAFLTVARRRKK